MSPYRVVAVPERVAKAVRETLVSPFAEHPAHAEVARGHGPCRVCLRDFEVGRERRILLTYDPFDGHEPLPLPGPIFIHESDCRAYPADGGIPADLRGHPTTLNAYGAGRVLREQAYAPDGDIAPLVDRLLERADVETIHVRDTEAGCFDFLIERDS